MSDFMGPPSGWYDPPAGHNPECNCESCHRQHVENGDFHDNANLPDFPCCHDEIESLVEKGKYCATHGFGYMQDRRCLECEERASFIRDRAVGE